MGLTFRKFCTHQKGVNRIPDTPSKLTHICFKIEPDNTLIVYQQKQITVKMKWNPLFIPYY